jgi:hypothetical protein
MTLNMNLWCDILEWIEAHPNIDSETIKIEGYTNDQIAYHVDMIAQEHPHQVVFVNRSVNKINPFPTYLGLRLARPGDDALTEHRHSL